MPTKVHEPLVSENWPLYPAVPTAAEEMVYMIRKSGDIRRLRDKLLEEDRQIAFQLKAHDRRKRYFAARLALEYARYDRNAAKIRAKAAALEISNRK